MVKHYENPRSFEFEVKKYVNKRVISGLYQRLVVEPSGCRHISIRMIKGMIYNIYSQLGIKPSIGLLETEKMLEKPGRACSKKGKVKNLSITALLYKNVSGEMEFPGFKLFFYHKGSNR